MTNLYTLRDMLDAATGPSRELDCAIFQALSGPRWVRVCVPKTVDNDGWLWQHDETGATTKEDPITSSIDAALALVERLLPGWVTTAGEHYPSDAGMGWIWSLSPNRSDYRKPMYAPTAPIAIMRSAVDALIAVKEADHG